ADFILISHPAFFVDDLEVYRNVFVKFLSGPPFTLVRQWAAIFKLARWRDRFIAARGQLQVPREPALAAVLVDDAVPAPRRTGESNGGEVQRQAEAGVRHPTAGPGPLLLERNRLLSEGGDGCVPLEARGRVRRVCPAIRRRRADAHRGHDGRMEGIGRAHG